VSLETRDTIMRVILVLTAASSACLYVAAVFYRAWAAVWAFGGTLLVSGIFAVVELARVLHEAS
jgi:hypothetical protein